MKTAMIAILPALLLCGTAQAQLGGVTDTAGAAVQQAGDPALAGQLGDTATGLHTSRIGGPSSRIERLRARQADRAARRAANASPPAPEIARTEGLIQGQPDPGLKLPSTNTIAAAPSETVQTATMTRAETTGPVETSLDAAVRQQLAEIQASPAAVTPPAAARVTYVDRSGAPSGGHSTHHDTVIVHDRQVATTVPAQPRSVAAAEIRVERHSSQPTPSTRSTGHSSSTSVWPLITAGLLIALLLGLSRQVGRRQRTA